MPSLLKVRFATTPRNWNLASANDQRSAAPISRGPLDSPGPALAQNRDSSALLRREDETLRRLPPVRRAGERRSTPCDRLRHSDFRRNDDRNSYAGSRGVATIASSAFGSSSIPLKLCTNSRTKSSTDSSAPMALKENARAAPRPNSLTNRIPTFVWTCLSAFPVSAACASATRCKDNLSGRSGIAAMPRGFARIQELLCGKAPA